MGSLQTWYWALVLSMLVLPVLAVAYARGGLSRPAFALRLAGSVAGTALAYGLAAAGSGLAIPLLVLLNLTYRWTAMRLIALGWSRWWALLWFLLPAGLILSVALCFMRAGVAEDPVAAFD
jgi:hypothetical protein